MTPPKDTLQKRRAELTPEQRAKLEQRLRGRTNDLAAAAGIPRRAATTPPLASFAQQRLWFLEQLAPNSTAYHIVNAVRLVGTLDHAALSASLNAVIARHEALRTTFAPSAPDVAGAEAVPVQVIAPALSIAIPIIDFSSVPSEEQHAAMAGWIATDAQEPFDLAQGPLLRANLFRLSATEHVFLITVHHIVFDGWSMSILIREVAAAYHAAISRHTAVLPALPIQYADFALWQRDRLESDDMTRLHSYWRQQLAGVPQQLALPTDRPRPAIQTQRGAIARAQLSAQLSRALESLSQREGVTLFMTLLTAWQVLLARWSGQTDIVVGSPIAGRDREELQSLIGCFVNTLALRSDLGGNPSFSELLQRVRSVALDAYAHAELPFEKLIDELKVGRDLSHNPLFQTMFVLQNIPVGSIEMPGLTLTPVEVDTATAKFDLWLFVADSNDGLRATLEYNTDLFDAATVQRMLRHFELVLEAIVRDLHQPIADVSLLTSAESRQIADWNDTARTYQQPGCLHQLFEQQAARSPDAVAVRFDQRTLTYDQLNQRANQVAHYLQKLGIRPDDLVGVCLHRSLDLVIAIYGILKAGAAYVPLDPDYPHERLAFMLGDAAVPVVLTHQALINDVPQTEAQIVCLDRDWERIAPEPTHNLDLDLTADHLAYLIYTSGSTGQPKGAMNTHRAICNRLLWMQETYQLTAADRVLQKTPFSFDVSVWEFFWPLLTGATLVVAQPGGHRDSAYLVRLIREQQITTLHFVPSMLQLFLEEAELQTCSSLRYVMCSGEALPFDLQQRFFARLDAQLHNLYGPTEAAVDVTFWACERTSSQRIVPIGQPVANTQIHILDERLRPVPVGLLGELYIGGVQLARGYHNRAALTAEKFIPDPFSAVAGARMYRSGDLARYLPSGAIEFLGRIDHQVKLRGFRIELGEIEAVLTGHPAVQESAVVVHQDSAGDSYLTAYVLTADNDDPTPEELRYHLALHVPEYMIPATFMKLSAFPLSPNGKLDRRQLPAPERQQITQRAAYVAPQTALETRLVEIWQDALDVTPIGIDDNFFDIGGTSFKAIRVLQQFDSSVSVIELFKHPTIRGLAAAVSQEHPTTSGLLHQLRQAATTPARTLVCTPYGGGTAIIYYPLAQALPSQYDLYAIALPGHDLSAQEDPLQAVEEIAAQCVAEITSSISGPIALYGHCVGGAVTLEIARQLEAAQVELEVVYLGGVLPPPRKKSSGLVNWVSQVLPFTRNRSDDEMINYLKTLGGFEEVIDEQELAFVMRNFWHDGRNATDYFERALGETSLTPLRAPICCIVGDQDPYTKRFQQRYADWSAFSSRVDLYVLKGGNHYFLKHQAAELAELIAQTHGPLSSRT